VATFVALSAAKKKAASVSGVENWLFSPAQRKSSGGKKDRNSRLNGVAQAPENWLKRSE